MAVTIRTTDVVERRLSNFYKTKSYGAERAVNSWIYIRENILDSLRGIFEADEIKYIINLNATAIFQEDLAFQSHVLITIIEDSMKYGDRVDPGIDTKKLIEKIKKLSQPQVFFLSEFCYEYWHVEGLESDRYIKRIL